MKNGKQTITIMISFALMVFAVIGWMWISLDGRTTANDRRIAETQQQTAVFGARLENIEGLLKEVRADVKAMREQGRGRR